MNLYNVGYILGAVYRYENKAQETTSGTDFMKCLQGDGKSKEEQIEAYKEYLGQRYGVAVTVQNVGKDEKSLDKVGKSMSGSDVIIAPNIIEKMANDPKAGAYYEKKIQDFFEAIPQETALFAAKGLVYEPGGVVIHEDGSVTYIGGCSDSPERVAEVEAENKEKQKKRAELRKKALERRQPVNCAVTVYEQAINTVAGSII